MDIKGFGKNVYRAHAVMDSDGDVLVIVYRNDQMYAADTVRNLGDARTFAITKGGYDCTFTSEKPQELCESAAPYCKRCGVCMCYHTTPNEFCSDENKHCNSADY
jgi:hypothetical protein